MEMGEGEALYHYGDLALEAHAQRPMHRGPCRVAGAVCGQEEIGEFTVEVGEGGFLKAVGQLPLLSKGKPEL